MSSNLTRSSCSRRKAYAKLDWISPTARNVSPSSLNHFDQEVDLRFRCATLTEADHRYMKWWNPSTSSWLQIKSWTNESDTTRCAPLKHFSTYATGKAGW